MKNLFKNLFNKRFDSEPIYNNGYTKTKISPKNMNFHDNKRPKKDGYYRNSIILLESIIDVDNNYYPQVFLEKLLKECNNPIKQTVQIFDESDDESDDDKPNNQSSLHMERYLYVNEIYIYK